MGNPGGEISISMGKCQRVGPGPRSENRQSLKFSSLGVNIIVTLFTMYDPNSILQSTAW